MILKKRKPILCLDFDGVIHSYESGWIKAITISDEPVPHAIPWLIRLLCEGPFRVAIFSSRRKYFGGKRAMKRWLRKWGVSKDLVKKISFPLLKPYAHLFIDDRALTFKGKFPEDFSELEKFSPWNRMSVYPKELE